jgi:DNA-binding response OmpR family regulator
MENTGTIVLVETSEVEGETLERLLRADHHDVEHLAGRWDVLERLTAPEPVTALVLGPGHLDREGRILAHAARWLRPNVPVVLLGETPDRVEHFAHLSPPAHVFARPLDGLAFLRTLRAVA